LLNNPMATAPTRTPIATTGTGEREEQRRAC
jgi:hypothetical protein